MKSRIEWRQVSPRAKISRAKINVGDGELRLKVEKLKGTSYRVSAESSFGYQLEEDIYAFVRADAINWLTRRVKADLKVQQATVNHIISYL